MSFHVTGAIGMRRQSVARFAALLLLTLVPQSPSLADVPYQFIAKTYSEALGRIPDQAGWASAVNGFTSSGCNATTLKNWGRSVYLSGEYSALGYDNAAKVLTLYLGVLNREPDAEHFNDWVSQLNSGTPFSTVVDAFYTSNGEFGNLVNAICGQSSYGFGVAAPIDIGSSGPAFTITSAAHTYTSGPTPVFSELKSQILLAELLNADQNPITVELAQKAVFRATSPLPIPPRTTVRTVGSPGANRYALQARVVRASGYLGSLVEVSKRRSGSISTKGGKLYNVWVDGMRGAIGYDHDALNVDVLGGEGATVSGCKISNAAGWTSLRVLPGGAGFSCSPTFINSNVITAYSSCHKSNAAGDNRWTDGISITCENALVEYNQIIDVSDVGIVLFNYTNGVQQSDVRYNSILNAGNSAFAALGADPGLYLTPPQERSFVGATYVGNTIWTGAGHLDVAIMAGVGMISSASGWGKAASFTNNVVGTPTAPCRVDVGIGISGMTLTELQGNSLNLVLVESLNGCAGGAVRINTAEPPNIALPSSCTSCDVTPTPGPFENCLGHGYSSAYCPSGIGGGGYGAAASDDASNSGRGDPGVAPGNGRILVVPNPTRAGAAFLLTEPAAKLQSLDIFDLHGRRVAALRAAGASSDRGITWDGRTDVGESLPAGIYHFVARTSRGHLTGRVAIER